MADTNMSVTQFGPNSPQAVTKSSSMVIISKWVITKGLNTKQKHLWATALYNDNVYSKEAAKIWPY